LNKSKSSISLFIFVVVLFTIGFAPYLTQEAFADQPTIDGFIVDDPDDGDTSYSVGDTITITFDVPTNQTGVVTDANIFGNFTFTNQDINDNTFSGTWTTNQILTLTVDAITTSPIIGTTGISALGTNNIGVLGETVDADNALGTDIKLTGDFGLFVAVTGGGCDNCEAPTLGISSNAKRLVDNGFSYNGKSVDVERYFTPYPLVTVKVGKQNVAEFKIYDDKGPDRVSHFELAFGLASGESIGMSKAVINWDKSFDGIETITLDDPENVLDNIKVTTFEGYCSDDSSQKCLIVKVVHTFRAPLDFNILGTNVWDFKRNAWQNYYNHGIEVVGESLNPPKEYDGINRGHIYHLTETGKNTAVDEFGNTWALDKTWTKDYVKPERIVDSDTDVFTRMHSEFAKYKDTQANDSIDQLLALCPTCLMPYADFEDSVSLEYSERISRTNDPELQKNLMIESEKAQKIMNHLLDPLLYRQ